MRILLATVLIAAAPAAAQVTAPDPGLYAKGYADRGAGSATTEAVNARQGPATEALNAQGAVRAGADTAAQRQYEADRAAYMAALVQHDAAVDRTDARYARQQRAYAEAMSDWRVQVQACKRGRQRACELPPPNVADYY